jgi:hypothetical protein
LNSRFISCVVRGLPNVASKSLYCVSPGGVNTPVGRLFTDTDPDRYKDVAALIVPVFDTAIGLVPGAGARYKTFDILPLLLPAIPPELIPPMPETGGLPTGAFDKNIIFRRVPVFVAAIPPT